MKLVYNDERQKNTGGITMAIIAQKQIFGWKDIEELRYALGWTNHYMLWWVRT